MSSPSLADRPIGVAVLGSTGSIGRQALEVLAGLGNSHRVIALAAGRDADGLSEQARRFRPPVAALVDPFAPRARDLPSGTEILGGPGALEALAARPDVDLVVVGTSGIVSLRPVLAALEKGKVVATANKETLVAGGHLVMPLARNLAQNAGGDVPALNYLRPIDSEHSAIWQCLAGERWSSVRRLILTASGGPFRA